MKYPCILFDFDGTLADSLQLAVKIFNDLSDSYGHKKIEPDQLASLRNMSTSQCIRALRVSRLRLPRLLLEGRKKLKENISEVKPVEGIPEMLRALRPHIKTIGVLTTNSRENVEAFLRTHGLEGMIDFISSTSKLSGKAKNIKAIMLTFGYGAKEMILIGDEIRDVKASQKTGIASAAVTWGFNSSQLLQARRPDYLIHHPQDLVEVMNDV